MAQKSMLALILCNRIDGQFLAGYMQMLVLRPNYFRFRTLPMLLCVLLSACGGGGGSAGSSGASSGETLVNASFISSNAEMPNPERGFYRWAWAGLDALTADDLQDAYDKGYRMVYVPLRLDAYRSIDLPAALLAKLNASFAIARSKGVKLLVRAVYNYPENETEYKNAQDATLGQVLKHISQLKPVFQQNADVIAYVQAGFVGAWGEWHTSSNNLTASSSRTQIRDALLAAVPAERFIQLRYPPYVVEWTPTLPSLATTLQGGYRVGVHNDCFLASTTDVGTYSDDASTRSAQQSHIADLSQLAPFGGETCNPADESNAQPRTTCAAILEEGAKYHLSYLNDEYYRDLFHTKWIANGCMAEVKQKMGYRLQLVSASHPASVSAGQTVSFELAIRNTGWARPFNPRAVQILLRKPGSNTVTRITASGADPRSWLPGQDSAATLSLAIPAGLGSGTYAVFIALPDPASTLINDPRFSIRPANADVSTSDQKWDSGLGAFQLGTQIQIL